MRPTPPSSNIPNPLPNVDVNDSATREDTETQRKTFMGRELPPADVPLPLTSESYYKQCGFQGGYRPHLSYMLLGVFPEGPFDGSPDGKRRMQVLTSLVNTLASEHQFSALNELVQQCAPLDYLRIDLSLFPAEKLTEFLANFSRAQPEVCELKISAPRNSKNTHADGERLTALIDFIDRSPHVTSFTFTEILKEFHTPIIEAIGKNANAEKISFEYGIEFTDATCDKLLHLIRASTQLKSVEFSGLKTSEENMLQLLLALRNSPQIEELSLSAWNFSDHENMVQLSGLIGHSPNLKHLSFYSPGFGINNGICPVTEAITNGIKKNKSLVSLELEFKDAVYIDHEQIIKVIDAAKNHVGLERFIIDEIRSLMPPIAQALAGLVESNDKIVEVNVPSNNLVVSIYRFVFRSMREEWSKQNPRYATLFPGSDLEIAAEYLKSVEFINDKLARNKAIASGKLAKIFSNAFFPSPGATPGNNHIGDPGVPLTEQILKYSPDLRNFMGTMVEVALTVDETARHEAAGTNETTKDPQIELRNTTEPGQKSDSGS